MYNTKLKKAVSSGYTPKKEHVMTDADRRAMAQWEAKYEAEAAFHAELMADAERDERGSY